MRKLNLLKYFAIFIAATAFLMSCCARSEADIFDDAYNQIIEALMNLDIRSAILSIKNASQSASAGTIGGGTGEYNPLTGEMKYSESHSDNRAALEKLQTVEASFFDSNIINLGDLGKDAENIERSGFSSEKSAALSVKTSEENAATLNSLVTAQDWITAKDKERIKSVINEKYVGVITAKYNAYVDEERARPTQAQAQAGEIKTGQQNRVAREESGQQLALLREEARKNAPKSVNSEQEARDFLTKYSYFVRHITAVTSSHTQLISYGYMRLRERQNDPYEKVALPASAGIEGYVFQFVTDYYTHEEAGRSFLVTKDTRVFFADNIQNQKRSWFRAPDHYD
jgi:hypothetical protein